MAPHNSGGIPDRWTNYTALGKRIPGTRFIAFKVPLKQSLLSRLPAVETFGPFDLVRKLEEEGHELGLVIDLTFTTRYYTPKDLPHTLHYQKIFTAGHEVPDNATILRFKKAVRHYLHENKDNDKLIGVHCTHGLNRTGYLVCRFQMKVLCHRYLIDVEGMRPKKAIKLFNASRGHSIERENYIDDLRNGPKRSNTGIEKPDQKPVQGCASLNQQDVRPHQSNRNYDGHFNGRRSHNGRQQYVPSHQNNSKFGPAEKQPFHPPSFPTRSPFPSQRFGAGQCSSTFPYPAPRIHYRFSDSDEERCELPVPSTEEPEEPQRSHKKRSHKPRKKERKDRTSSGNTGDLQ